MSKLVIIEKPSQVDDLIDACKTTGYASHDYETTGLRFLTDTPLIMGVSFQPGVSWILPMGHKESPFRKSWPKHYKRFTKAVFEDPEIVKVAWNLKFEYKWAMRLDTKLVGRVMDGMLAKYCLDEERPHGLKPYVERMFPTYAGYDKDLKNLGDDTDAEFNWENTPFDKLCKYCGIDSDLTLRGMVFMENKLMDLGFYNLFRNLLMMGSRVLAESEYRGALIDRPYLEDLMVKYKTKIEEAQTNLKANRAVNKFEAKRRKEIFQELVKSVQLEIEDIAKGDSPNAARLIANRQSKIKNYMEGKFNKKEEEKMGPINFGSPKQLAEFLYTSKHGLKLKCKHFTDTGNPSTGEEALESLKKYDKTGFMDHLLTLRGLEKIDSTYVRGIHPLVDHLDRVHATFKIEGTVTGRLSCKGPNLQNIPRGTTAADIKKMFIPPKGFLLMEVDYSQAELRVVAEVANDKAMIDIFARDYNIHVATACKSVGKLDKYDEVKKMIKVGEAMDLDVLNLPENKEILFWVKQKKKAKTINFGILYGQGPDKLAEGMGVTVEEAEEFTAQWYKAYPEVEAWIKRQKKYAQKYGYVYNMFGRKRRLYNINSEKYGLKLEAERQAVNTPIQGTASDFGLFSQVVIREKILRGEFPRDLHQVYTVHDSIGYYIRPQYIHELVPQIVEICANPQTKEYFGFELKKVKMKVSPEIGKDWADLTEYSNTEDYGKWIL